MTKPGPEHYQLSFPRLSGMPLGKNHIMRRTSEIRDIKPKLSVSGFTGKAERRNSQSISKDWASIMNKDDGNNVQFLSSFIHEHKRPIEFFCTGSNYTGTWNDFGMAGQGTYNFFYDVEYDGEMEDGMFHGLGTLTYPRGQKIQGIWDQGELMSFKYIFTDGLEYDQSGSYCKYPDRRLHASMKEGLQPAPKEFLTNQQPSPKIPEHCYDVGNGFFNVITKCIICPAPKISEPAASRASLPVSMVGADSSSLCIRQPSAFGGDVDESTNYSVIRASLRASIGAESSSLCIRHPTAFGSDVDDSTNYIVLSVPTKTEVNWIKSHCRKAWDQPTGYRPELYEHWTTGRATELKDILSRIKYTEDELNVICRMSMNLKEMLSLVGQHDASESVAFFNKTDDFLWSDVLLSNTTK